MGKTERVAPGPVREGESVSVDVRKIANGYITRTTRSGPEGYASDESFSAERPAVEVEAGAGRDKSEQPSAMRRAIGKLNSRR